MQSKWLLLLTQVALFSVISLQLAPRVADCSNNTTISEDNKRDCSEWIGVLCRNKTRHVYALDLHQHGALKLKGSTQCVEAFCTRVSGIQSAELVEEYGCVGNVFGSVCGCVDNVFGDGEVEDDNSESVCVRANGLEDLLDSSKCCPDQLLPQDSEDSTETQINPAFIAWKRKDQMLLSWLMSSINLEILSLVVNSETSLDLWISLEQQFGSETFTKKVHLKIMLNNLKKGSMSMTDFFGKLKLITDELAIAGNPISSLDFITHLISGLGQPYYPVVVYIKANLAKMSINEAYTMLLTHEARLEAHQSSANKEAKLNYAANIAQTGSNNKSGNQFNNNWNKNTGNNNGGRGGYGRGYTQGQGRGNWNNNWSDNGMQTGNYQGRGSFQTGNYQGRGYAGNGVYVSGNGNGNFARSGGGFNIGKNFLDPNIATVTCQICFKPRHTTAECRNKFNRDFAPFYPTFGYNPAQSQVPRAAFLTTSEGEMADQGWYIDSGATHHLTNNLQNLNLGKEYSAVQELEPYSVKAALADPKWKQAMQDEYEALQKNETWVLVPKGSAGKIVGNKWVFRVKYKARLVAKGFHQTQGVDFFETFSPVVKQCTIRVILSLAVMHNWTVRQLDVNNAFLHGILTENVFMHQPEGFVHPQFPSHICQLTKALYGLKQAPRAWYDRLKSSLLQWGFIASKSDTSLFIHHVGEDIVVILIYVDDILITGSNSKFVEGVINKLGTEFALKDLGEFNYFLGLEVTPSVEGLHLSQTKSLVGSLQYVTLTRPEIAFTFYSSGSLNLTAFSYADWGSDLDDRRSVGRYCVYLGNSLISWSSKKQHIVSKSTAESEYRALALAAAEVLWITYLLKELKMSLQQTPVIHCDNKSAEALASNPKYHSTTKHIELDLHFIREHIAKKELQVSHVPSHEQVADILTKPLAYDQFNYLRSKLNVLSRP
ncbi:retrovirus-related pol polyprotein from transposon RE1 [Citrus sinensis]|uniref:Retrovirus-related pol polyprotein from transposon RE1 n=1 Tax=Citrus sinensis TaxID=2711 RepID=A0ACB8HS49_CITSI|nr:retrovirus-related pol polyprotein from transposon RE1 [Citrus sinensis]